VGGSHACATPAVGEEPCGHRVILDVDIGTPGEELVDDAEPTVMCRHEEDGPATLRWRSERAGALEIMGVGKSGA
jgi:hypothetical protein